MRPRPWIRIFLALTLSPLLITGALWAESQTLEDFGRQINEKLFRSRYRSMSWGIQILDAERRAVLFARNADRLFVPASNTKLFTTAIAFEKLGANFRFQTNAYLNSSSVADGVVEGDLILEGRGAFNFSDTTYAGYSPSALLDDLAIQIAARGIRQINGNLLAHDAYFRHTHDPVTVRAPRTRGKKKATKALHKSVESGACPLSLNESVLRISVTPAAQPGEKVAVYTIPHTDLIKIENRGQTGSRRSKKTLKVTKKGDQRIVITGKLPAYGSGVQTVIPISDPPRFTASLFKEILAAHGVRLLGSVNTCFGRSACGGSRESWQPVAKHESRPLSEIIQVINKDSHNNMSELLLRALGSELRGEGTPEAGLRVEEQFLEEIGISSAEANLVDGSGLSKENLATPQAIIKLLNFVYTRDYFPAFFNTLAVGGVDGTLRGRMGFSESRESIHAKTGTLSNSITLSGYLALNGKPPILFSIMANKSGISVPGARQMIDQICDLMIQHLGAAGFSPSPGEGQRLSNRQTQ